MSIDFFCLKQYQSNGSTNHCERSVVHHTLINKGDWLAKQIPLIGYINIRPISADEY